MIYKCTKNVIIKHIGSTIDFIKINGSTKVLFLKWFKMVNLCYLNDPSGICLPTSFYHSKH